MSIRLKFAVRLVACLAVLLSAGWAHGQAYTSVVVFGDSLSDTGNFASVVNGQYGLTYPGTSFNYTNGRFTNGTSTTPAATAYSGVWVEQMAAQFAAKPAVTNSLGGGTNYAYGEATTQDGMQTIPLTAGLSVTIPNMGQQITTYLGTNPKVSASTLYVLFGGSNDLFADSSTAGVTAAAQREAALVQRLIMAGATQFMVPNLPPLGNTPSYIGTSSAASLNTAAALFRSLLATDLQTVIATAAASNTPVTIYQPDLYTKTSTIEAAPGTYALSNVTASEQGQTNAFPDTYLFWDAVHPTTTGHHFIAQAGENLLSALAASSTALSVIPASAGATTLRAVVTGTGPAKLPGGLVTFYGTTGTATTPIATAVLDATGTGMSTYTGSAPTSAMAVYAGDTAYTNSSSAAVPFAAPMSPTTTTLMASSTAVTLGSPVTFTATVSSAGGTPTGSVTFSNGTAQLGSGTLNGSGVATFTTSALPLGPNSVTAAYATTGMFTGSTSSAVSVAVSAPTIGVSFSPTTLTITHGSSGMATVNISNVGASGTVSLSCGALPAHASCTFSPATVTLNGTAVQTSTLTIGTTAVSALSMPGRPGRKPELAAYACSLLLVGLGALGRRKRWAPGLLALLFLSAGTLALSGCGGASTPATPTTAAGSYSVVVTAAVSSNSAITSQGTLTVVVQ